MDNGLGDEKVVEITSSEKSLESNMVKRSRLYVGKRGKRKQEMKTVSAGGSIYLHCKFHLSISVEVNWPRQNDHFGCAMNALD